MRGHLVDPALAALVALHTLDALMDVGLVVGAHMRVDTDDIRLPRRIVRLVIAHVGVQHGVDQILTARLATLGADTSLCTGLLTLLVHEPGVVFQASAFHQPFGPTGPHDRKNRVEEVQAVLLECHFIDGGVVLLPCKINLVVEEVPLALRQVPVVLPLPGNLVGHLGRVVVADVVGEVLAGRLRRLRETDARATQNRHQVH